MRTIRMAVLSALLFSAMFGALTGRALSASSKGPCEDKYGNVVADCHIQIFTLTLGKSQTVGWALFCPIATPYYWGAWSADWSAKGGTATENLLAESSPDKADFTFTNWRPDVKNSLTLFYGCSSVPPWGQACHGKIVHDTDPGCSVDSGSQHKECAGSDEDESCWNVWNETCPNGSTFTCSNVAIINTCTGCQVESSSRVSHPNEDTLVKAPKN